MARQLPNETDFGTSMKKQLHYFFFTLFCFLQVYAAGVKNIDLSIIINEIAAPAIMGLSLVAAVPYVLAELVTIVFGKCLYVVTIVYSCCNTQA